MGGQLWLQEKRNGPYREGGGDERHDVKQRLEPVFPERPAGKLAHLWDEEVEAGDRLAVGVRQHVEGLLGLWIVGHKDGTAKMLGEVLLVLRLEGDAEPRPVLERRRSRREEIDGLLVGNPRPRDLLRERLDAPLGFVAALRKDLPAAQPGVLVGKQPTGDGL